MVKETYKTAEMEGKGSQLLMTKLWRDLTWNWTQFLAMALLCALGTCVFCGLDATWRLIERSMDKYYAETELADIWLTSNSFSKVDLQNVLRMDGVENAQLRFTESIEVRGLEKDTVLVTHAVDDDFEVNIPFLKEGSPLESGDIRGCLVDERFAEANGLKVDDILRLDIYGSEIIFTIRGTIQASEHVSISRSIEADPKHYSFAYVSHRSLSGLGYTDIVITLADGTDLNDIESKLESMFPNAVIEDRGTNESSQNVSDEIQIYKDMTLVFPLIMFAVSVLIAMTTLRRMIERQRIEMGTLKAIGFNDRTVRKHYLNYALVPSVIGSFVGILLGQTILPNVLWATHQGYSNYPPKVYPFVSGRTWLMAGLMIAINLLICLRTYNKAAKEAGAALLRPKPPAAGNRVLIERIPELWNKFTTNGKMIVRNLMRNKLRTVVSTVGILFCCMMILCTLGLMDSIRYFVTNHYFGTLQYDVNASVDGSAPLQTYRNRIEADSVDGTMTVIVSVRSADMKRTMPMFVTNDDQSTYYLGMGTTFMPLPAEGIAISWKTAEVMHISPGDTVTVYLPGDDKPMKMTVAALADTNLELGIYISEHEWNSYRKYEFVPNKIFAKGATDLAIHELKENDTVSAVKFPKGERNETMKNMNSVRSVFVIMCLVALGLSFTICYNMGLMNFAERSRDYATFKVLGYHHNEICRMMYIENSVSSVVGILLAIWPGIKLTTVVLRFAEPETVVYAPYVSVFSVILACVITFAYSLFITWVLTLKVKEIDMVQALKSVD